MRWPPSWVPPAGSAAPPSGLPAAGAREQGIDVKDRGRVPADLVVKFKAATGQ